LNRYHGIASLVDVFYITNEKRKICKWIIELHSTHIKIALISPDDLLKACSKFELLNLPIRLKEINKGLKVIQDGKFYSLSWIQNNENSEF